MRSGAEMLEREWVSVAEAEALTGRSRWTWRKDAYVGRIGSAKVGKMLMLRLADVRDFMERGFRPAIDEQRDGVA